jgi:ATP-dependent DNA ligase
LTTIRRDRCSPVHYRPSSHEEHGDWLSADASPALSNRWNALPVEEIPEGEPWTYELKLDGYRLVAVKAAGKVTLYSRRSTGLSRRFRNVTAALAALPDENVIDGELVALDEQGKPNFNLLQNFRSADSHIMFYTFDVIRLKLDFGANAPVLFNAFSVRAG